MSEGAGGGGGTSGEPASSDPGALCAQLSKALWSRRTSYSRVSTARGILVRIPLAGDLSRRKAASKAGLAAKFPTDPFNRWASRSSSWVCPLPTARRMASICCGRSSKNKSASSLSRLRSPSRLTQAVCQSMQSSPGRPYGRHRPVAPPPRRGPARTRRAGGTGSRSGDRRGRRPEPTCNAPTRS